MIYNKGKIRRALVVSKMYPYTLKIISDCPAFDLEINRLNSYQKRIRGMGRINTVQFYALAEEQQ